jgi:hypothetical protein
MKPVPSTETKTYPERGPLQQFGFAAATAFTCFRCRASKKSKLISIYGGDWSRKLCNGCYGRLLSLYDIKAGTAPEDERAEQLARSLLWAATANEQEQAERLFRASESRASALCAEALRFVTTAEHVAGMLDTSAQLEWSPAVIGLCKAVEAEVVSRVLRPLATEAASRDLSSDKEDKDIGRIAAFCSDPQRKPPELGTFAHFLQTAIHSETRRAKSPLIGSFLRLAGTWTGSTWVLDPSGLHGALVRLTTTYRNRAAHIDELDQTDYNGCRQLTVGYDGLVWKLVVSTETHR